MLIVKEAYYDQAKLLFSNSQIHVTTSGNRHLGAVIGDEDCTTKYVDMEVQSWINQLEILKKYCKNPTACSLQCINSLFKA